MNDVCAKEGCHETSYRYNAITLQSKIGTVVAYVCPEHLSDFIRACIKEGKQEKQRVRVSFDFDITVNDAPIHNSGNDDDVKQYDLALLRSFLVADKEKLLHMMIDAIGSELGLNSPETFMAQFLPQIDTNCHTLFSKAIDALRGDARDYWGHALPLATEKIFECFNAEFVSSDCKIVGE